MKKKSEFHFELTDKAKAIVKNAAHTIGRPLKDDKPKSEKITVRIETKEKALLIKTYGSISEGINQLLKRFLKESDK